jgi:hypothetical protein
MIFLDLDAKRRKRSYSPLLSKEKQKYDRVLLQTLI